MTIDLQQFLGNPEAYAVQNQDGSYTPVREKFSDQLLSQHLQGEVTLGTYVVWYDRARFFVFDIDEHDLGLAKALAAECAVRGLQAGVEFSGRKGFHVWVLLDAWLPAGHLQRLAKNIAQTVGFNGEVFPKQAAVRDLGSLVKLPLGKHAVTGNPSRFLTEPVVNSADLAVEAVGLLPPEPVKQVQSSGPLPCLDSIQNDPPKPGTRNNLYFHFACHLRRMGLGDEAVEAVLTELWENPDPGEIQATVENSRYSGPTCDSIPSERHCGAACIKNRARGLSLRPGQLRHGQPGELIVLRVGPHNTPTVLDLEHPDAEQAKAVLRKNDGK